MATKIIASATVRAVKKRVLPSRAALVLTPSAVNKIKEIMSKEEAKGFVGLKVGVRQRGCNGLSYTLDYAKCKDKLDEEVKQDGVTIIIDKKAQLTLLGNIYLLTKVTPDHIHSLSQIKNFMCHNQTFTIRLGFHSRIIIISLQPINVPTTEAQAFLMDYT
jgi:iron-sulfur cluster assembly 1